MSSLRSIARFTRIFLLSLLLIIATTAGAEEKKSPPVSPADLEMGNISSKKIEASKVDPAVLASFKKEYEPVKASARPVFEKYLPLMGSAALLDFLEQTYPACHAQSHDLGKALFAASGDLGTALRECGTRCTSGCMHGAVGEAFGSSTLEAITAKMNTFCGEGEMARLHKPGNCAHGLGHAFMFVNNGDVKRSIDACLGFKEEPMQYYCATGVFMEKILTGAKPAQAPTSRLAPCDEETLFPSACYRYKGVELLQKYREPMAMTLECVQLAGAQRRGCFHGLGSAVIGEVFDNPRRIADLCSKGSREDKIVCIEGAIEKLAELNVDRAKAACASLYGEMRGVCEQSLKQGMYSLDKPTFALYYDKDAVAQRRATLKEDEKKPQDHSHHH